MIINFSSFPHRINISSRIHLIYKAAKRANTAAKAAPKEPIETDEALPGKVDADGLALAVPDGEEPEPEPEPPPTTVGAAEGVMVMIEGPTGPVTVVTGKLV